MVEDSLRAWGQEKRETDLALERHPTLSAVGTGNGHSVRWNLCKLIGEHARHNGHADLLRERIDVRTGE